MNGRELFIGLFGAYSGATFVLWLAFIQGARAHRRGTACVICALKGRPTP